eukprot:553277-Alexandrium_andersonii.AAC.2
MLDAFRRFEAPSSVPRDASNMPEGPQNWLELPRAMPKTAVCLCCCAFGVARASVGQRLLSGSKCAAALQSLRSASEQSPVRPHPALLTGLLRPQTSLSPPKKCPWARAGGAFWGHLGGGAGAPPPSEESG